MDKSIQKSQALKNIRTLTRTFNLRPDLKEACINDDILYSVAIRYQHRHWAISRSVAAHDGFAKIVHDFEEKYGAYVYHCIVNGDLLTMLFVGQYQEEWDYLCPVLNEKVVYAAVHNTTYNFTEFGYVTLDKLSGTLIRIA